MTDNDTRDMIQRCIEEISMLRARIAELAPKADAYATVTRILGLLPQHDGQGYGIDIVWQLKKQLEELQPKVPAEPEPAA